jgi:polar amino acid transport system substrate-binding protein
VQREYQSPFQLYEIPYLWTPDLYQLYSLVDQEEIVGFMRVRIFVILFFWLVVCSPIHASQTLVINTTGKFPLNASNQTGFMDQVAAEVFRRSGLTLKTIQLPAERGLINANKGIEDGEMSRIAGLEKIYPNLVRVPEKIMDWEFYAFSEHKVDLTNGWSDLSGYSVAFINGWKILEKNVPSEAEIIKVKNPKQLFNLLEKRRAQIIIYERWAGLRYIKQLQLKAVRLIQPVLAERKMYIYLNKKHKALVPQLDGALKDMKADGTYKKLVQQILEPFK